MPMKQSADACTNEPAFTIFEKGDTEPRREPALRSRASTTPQLVRALPRKLDELPLTVRADRLCCVPDKELEPGVTRSTPRLPTTHPQLQLSEPVERRLIQVLRGEPIPGETIDAEFRRKEQCIGAIFAGLSVLEARTLHRRLTLQSPSDVLAAEFSRLIEARRRRLLSFLVDARRRQAITLRVGEAP